MNNNHNNSGKLGSVLVGAALGAAAVTLAHKPTRDKVRNAFRDVIEKGDEALDELEEKAGRVREKARKTASRELGKVERKLAQKV